MIAAWRRRRLRRKVARSAVAYLGGLEAFVAERRQAEAEGRLTEWRVQRGIICAACHEPEVRCDVSCSARLAGGWER